MDVEAKQVDRWRFPVRATLTMAGIGLAAVVAVNLLAFLFGVLARTSATVEPSRLEKLHVVIPVAAVLLLVLELVRARLRRPTRPSVQRMFPDLERHFAPPRRSAPAAGCLGEAGPVVRTVSAGLALVLVLSLAVVAAKGLAYLVPAAMSYDFTVSLAITAVAFLPTLRPSVLGRQSWKKVGDVWLKWSGVSAVAVGGFGFVGVTDELEAVLLELALERSQLGLHALASVWLGTILLLVVASLFKTLGTASAESETSRQPMAYFAPAFGTAWLGNLAGFTLLLDSVLLTFAAHFDRVPT